MAVNRLEVHSIRPFAGGAVFGDTGPYRQIDGIVHLAVDPDHPANEVITDIKLAPRDAAGGSTALPTSPSCNRKTLQEAATALFSMW